MTKHKFFEGFLDLDLDALKEDMLSLRDSLIDGNVGSIPEEELAKYRDEKNQVTSQVTGLAGYYNIFTLGYSSMDALWSKLQELTLEACDYYGTDVGAQDYMIRGWLNVSYGSSMNQGAPRPKYFSTMESFHEHNDGKGMPDLHGYYCIAAEPSITHYMINKTELYENHNVDNRVILSETGHPHRVDVWEYDTPRITVAYDICPKLHQPDDISVPLW